MVWYAAREQVKRALDIAITQEVNSKVDRAIAGATDSIEGMTNRVFYPILDTRKFDWPDEHGRQGPFRVLFGPNEVIGDATGKFTTFTAGGTVIPSSAYMLRNYADRPRPPYTYLEMDLSSDYALAAGTTWQQSLVATGLFGYRNDTVPGGTLAAGVNDTTSTTITVSDSSKVDVGNLILVGTERMIVTDKAWVASGATVSGSALTNQSSNTGVTLSSAAVLQNEYMMIDSEMMFAYIVTGSLYTVIRAFQGTTIAAHNTGVAAYVPRTLTVQRGAAGTTATTHSQGDAITVWQPPDLINQLCIGEAVNGLLQENSGWAKTVGAGDNVQNAVGAGLEDLRARAQKAFGRKLRGPYAV